MQENSTPTAGVNVPVGVSTVAGGGVSLVAFVLAVIAFATGAHDAETLALLATGLVSLVTVLLGRYAQSLVAASPYVRALLDALAKRGSV